jgi:hypothetical protein
MRQFMDSDDRDRIKSICEGIRRGLARTVLEPLPNRLEELLRVLRSKEQPPEAAQAAKGQAPASR